MNPNPGCEGECLFRVDMGITTCAYYPPVYDKHGNNINPDGNVTSGTMSCYACKREWTYATQYGETIFQEIMNSNC